MRRTRPRLFPAASLCLLLGLGAAASASAAPPLLPGIDTTPPASPVKLIFIHHSTGENWLNDGNGGLGLALRDNNYFVSDTNYGWGPDGIGDNTDIGHWWLWFAGPSSATYMSALYTEYGQHSSYSRLATDPGGQNEIVMFKSCFPNSALGGSPDDPPTTGSNPLRGQGAGSEYHTVGNAKGIYNDILAYFQAHPEKLFVVIAAPPLAEGATTAEQAVNARAFNNWLHRDWLASYPYKNVVVFDFYNVLTSNGGDADVNDLGQQSGNHHRVFESALQHRQGVASDLLAYPTGDSHPSQAGNLKATGEFAALLNVAYNAWHTATLEPAAFALDAHAGSGNLNGVLEPGETVQLEPAWRDWMWIPVTTAGSAYTFDGPAGATYSIVDATADYGTFGAGASGSCYSTTGNCYVVTVSDPSSRPAAHWDTTLAEGLAVGSYKVWSLHVGRSYADVPPTHWAYKSAETLLHRGIAGGCGGGSFCLSTLVNRRQMAVFLALAMATEPIPASGTVPGLGSYNCVGGGQSVFLDLPPTDAACKHVHAIAAKEVVGGCGSGNFCPSTVVDRRQMAVFLARAIANAPVPASGTVPGMGSFDCSAGGQSVFLDVPPTEAACRYIHYVAAKGITAGCGGGNYCPTTSMSRGQMAVFVSLSFGLSLYGP